MIYRALANESAYGEVSCHKRKSAGRSTHGKVYTQVTVWRETKHTLQVGSISKAAKRPSLQENNDMTGNEF